MSRSLGASDNKELFFATLAHDLKNPVQAQILSLKMLSEGAFGKLNSRQKDILNIILESSNYMNNMLLALLNSYKFDNCVIFLTKNEFCAKELVQNCINEVKTFAESKNIKIIQNCSNTKICADSIQLRRVISNLLNNSLNYSFKDSNLIISITNDEKNTIFSIENSSPEIPEEIKEHIFEKYISGTQTGIGLGLYMCKRVVEAHKGKIYLEGCGTTNKFIFEIPLNDTAQASINW